MDLFGPNDVDGLRVWLDANDSESMDKGTFPGESGTPLNNNTIGYWGDKSGNNHHARTLAGTSTFQSTGLNSLPTISLPNASLVLDDSGASFDNWEELHVFAVLYQTAFSHFSSVFGKTNHHGWANNNSHNFSWFLQIHRADKNGHKIWGPALNTSTGGNSYMTTGKDSIWTHSGFNGGPSLINISYSSNSGSSNFLFRIDGKNEKTSTRSGSIKAAPDLNLVIGGKSNGSNNWHGKISEFIIFDSEQTNSDKEKIEGYLAHKWQINNKLPNSHPFVETSPSTPPEGFEFFDGLVDDLRIYDRVLTAQEIGEIHAGDLSEDQNTGGQNPRVTLFWGDEDGGTNPEVNSSSNLAWDQSIELGEKEIGVFSYPLSDLEIGKTYHYRFLAENDAGTSWSPSTASFSSGTFSLAADTWTDADQLLWLDAADINGDGKFDNEPFGGSVDIWRDKSGENRHASNGHGPELIFRQLNQKSIVRFDGNGNFLRIPDYESSSPKDLDIGEEGTLFAVLKAEETSPGSFILSKGWTESSGWSFLSNASDVPTFSLSGTSADDQSQAMSAWNDQFKIFLLRKSDTRRILELMACSTLIFWMLVPSILPNRMI